MAFLSTSSPFMSTSMLSSTINFEYSKPVLGVYQSIDNNYEVRKHILKYYFDLLRDKWLLDDMNSVLNYFIVKDGHVQLIHNINDYSKKNILNDTDVTAELKVKYIEKNIFGRDDLYDTMDKFASESGIKWVYIPKHEYLFKKVVKKAVIREIIRAIRRGGK